MKTFANTTLAAALALGLFAVPTAVTMAAAPQSSGTGSSNASPAVGLSEESAAVIYGDDGFTLEFFGRGG